VRQESVHEQIRHQFGRKPQIAELNLRAFQLGIDAASEFLAKGGGKPAATKKSAKRPQKKMAKRPAKKTAKRPAKKTAKRSTRKG
jgi:topoisomerase IA-like protein